MVRMMKSPAQFTARRGGLAIVNALAAVAFSTTAISSAAGHHARDPVYFALWFGWMLSTLIWTFGVPGYWRWNAAERAVINDDLVKAHQAIAAKGALAVAMIGMGVLSVGTFFQLAIPAWTLPTVTCATVVSAALIFGWLERRDG